MYKFLHGQKQQHLYQQNNWNIREFQSLNERIGIKKQIINSRVEKLVELSLDQEI